MESNGSACLFGQLVRTMTKCYYSCLQGILYQQSHRRNDKYYSFQFLFVTNIIALNLWVFQISGTQAWREEILWINQQIADSNVELFFLIVILYYILISMIHQKYNNKKKTSPNNLINFQDFVKFRTDKEKIITNPFEENWKKAIVFQQLLELYKPQDNNFLPKNTIYDRKDFENFYKHKTKFDEEDSIWENNEDYQLNKLYKMTEGINNYEEQFQFHKIAKTAQKVQAREKSRRHIEKADAHPNTEKATKQQKDRCSKQGKIYFRKENLKEFQLFLDFKQKPRKTFLAWKGKIQKLQKKAVEQYGVVFPKEENSSYQSVDYAQYKVREDAIFQKFIRLSPQKQNNTKEPIDSPKSFTFEEFSNVPKVISKHLLRPNTSCPSSPVKIFKESSKFRGFVRKKYFRVPAV